MQIYLVGGAVRDELLGLIVKDKDYVVVGSTQVEMETAGFKSVGKDFPVFLHPITHDEYALARTERKTKKGYKGFAVNASIDVTLEEDLARRDLTINAIAKTEDGQLIDPYHGLADIKAKTLRHVSSAFSEDPVRILRAARFSARFTDFTVAPETNQLMQDMVSAGEVDALVSERVWQELAKGLMEAKPSRMFEVLHACGALKKILPELDLLWGVPQSPKQHPEDDIGVHVMKVIDYAANHNFNLPIRFAALMQDLGKEKTPSDELPRHFGHEERSVHLLRDLCNRLRIPNDCKELAQLVVKFQGKLHLAPQMSPVALLEFLVELDAIRRPDRFKSFLKACEADLHGGTGFETSDTPVANLMLKVHEAASNEDVGVLASTQSEPDTIKVAVFEARLKAVKRILSAV